MNLLDADLCLNVKIEDVKLDGARLGNISRSDEIKINNISAKNSPPPILAVRDSNNLSITNVDGEISNKREPRIAPYPEPINHPRPRKYFAGWTPPEPPRRHDLPEDGRESSKEMDDMEKDQRAMVEIRRSNRVQNTNIRSDGYDQALLVSDCNDVNNKDIYGRRRSQETGVTNIHLNNHGSIVGNVGTGNTIRDISAGDISVQLASEICRAVRRNQDDLVASGADAAELERRVAAVEAAAKGNAEPGMLRALLTDLRNTLSGAAGNIVANGVMTTLAPYLGAAAP